MDFDGMQLSCSRKISDSLHRVIELSQQEVNGPITGHILVTPRWAVDQVPDPWLRVDRGMEEASDQVAHSIGRDGWSYVIPNLLTLLPEPLNQWRRKNRPPAHAIFSCLLALPASRREINEFEWGHDQS